MKIGFVLLSNERQPQPSTRIAALNMIPHLRAAGWDVEIIFQPRDGCEQPDLSALSAAGLRHFDVVVFQKVHGASVLALVRALKEQGVRTVYSVCDLVQIPMAEACDLTLTISDYLKSLYPLALQDRIRVVHDGIENSALVNAAWRLHRGGPLAPLRALLVTSAELGGLPQIGLPPPWLTVDIVGRYAPAERPLQRWRAAIRQVLRQRGWKARLAVLRFLTHPRIRRIAWSPEAVDKALLRADFAILPIETPPAMPGAPPPVWMMKSANRLTLKMSAGLAVLSTPIPAYEEVLQHGVNGLFASSVQEWRDGLEQLRDPNVRRRLGRAARDSALKLYSAEAQAAALKAALAAVVSGVSFPA